MPLGSTLALPGFNRVGFATKAAFDLQIHIPPLESAPLGGFDLVAGRTMVKHCVLRRFDPLGTVQLGPYGLLFHAAGHDG